MGKVAIQDKYLETLAALGDVQSAVDLALQRYTIEQVTAKLVDLRRREGGYRAKYGLDYLTFAQRVTTDADFVQQVESRLSKMWEADLADWEFCYKGIQDWTQRLQQLLLG